MEVMEDGMDLDTIVGPSADLLAARAFLNARMAAAAAAAGGGARDSRRWPPMPLVPPSKPHHVDMAPPSPPSAGGGRPLSPLGSRLPYDQHYGGGGSGGRGLAHADRGTALSLPTDWVSLQHVLAQSGATNGHPPSAILRLLMQSQTAAAAAGVGGGAGGMPQSTARSSSGGSAGGSDRIGGGSGAHSGSLQAPAAAGGVGVTGLAGPGRSAAHTGGQQQQSSGKGSGGGGGGSGVSALGDGLFPGRAHGTGPADALPAHPSNRTSSSGSGAATPAVEPAYGMGGFAAGSMAVSPDVLKALIAANGGGPAGLGSLGLGAPNAAGPPIPDPAAIGGAQLQSLLQQLGALAGSAGAGANCPAQLNGVNDIKNEILGFGGGGGGGVVQQLVGHLVGADGSDVEVGGGGGGMNDGLGGGSGGSSGGGVNGLEMLAALLKAEAAGTTGGKASKAMNGGGGGPVASGAGAAVPLSPQHVALWQLCQQAPQASNGVSNGMGYGASATLGGVVSSLQLGHLLPGALGGGGRMPLGGMESLDDSDMPSSSVAAAAAAAIAAAAVAARDTSSVLDTRGGGGTAAASSGAAANSGRGGSGSGNRPTRNGSSEVGGGGGNSKGPTGLQLLRNLVTSGAAGAGVAGLMNGAGGLADLAVLPGGVATQLMEDLESLGYRMGMGGGLIGSQGRRSAGTGAAAVSSGSRSGDITARLGGAGAPGATKSRFLPPSACSPGIKKPNKRPENGSLATQILKRQRHVLAMQQQGFGSDAAGGPSASLPVVPPPPPPPPLLAGADTAVLLGSAGAGLGGVGGAGGMSELANVFGGLPPVAATAALLAAQPSVNAAALAKAIAAARNGGAGSGPSSLAVAQALSSLGTMLNGTGVGGCGSGAASGAGGGPSCGATAAQLQALPLAGLPAGAASAVALLGASRLPRAQCLGASQLLGQPVPKGRRSRRSARATGPMKLRNIMRDLGVHAPQRAPPGEAWQSERTDSRGEPPQGSGSSGGSGDAVGADAGGGPAPRRQRLASAAAPAEVPPVPVAACAGPPAVSASRAGSGAGAAGAADGPAPAGDSSPVGATSISSAGSGLASLVGLNWELIARSAAAGIPLATAVARMLASAGLPGANEAAVANEGPASLAPGSAAAVAYLSAAAARAAAAGPGGGAALSAAPKRPAAAMGSGSGGAAATPATGPSTRQPTPPPRGGPAAGKAAGAAAGPAGKGAAATAATGGSAAPAAAAAATKSRRKGGAPSRAAD